MNVDLTENEIMILDHSLEAWLRSRSETPGEAENRRTLATPLREKLFNALRVTRLHPHELDKDYLRQAAKAVEAKLPDNHGFILLVAPWGNSNGRLTYISSLERESALSLLKEWLLKAGAAEDWMKHIK